MCQTHGLSTYGSRDEKLQRFKNHIDNIRDEISVCSIGNTNNVCESQIRLLEESISTRVIGRLDYLIDPIVERLHDNLKTISDSP